MKQYHFARQLAVLLCAGLLSACSFVPNHSGYDDLIKITVENAAPAEAETFISAFRYEINDELETDYVGKPIASNSAKFTLKITVLDTNQGQPGQQSSAAVRAQMLNYNYQIRLALIRNQDKHQVWTWQPDQVMTYSDYKKSIKWLARYSAKTLAKRGYFKDEHFK